MRINLFDKTIEGKIIITENAKSIWYIRDIIKNIGEESACKLFFVFDKCYDLNPMTNPFINIPEEEKFEVVLRATYPELDQLIDLDDEIILEAFDLIGELYSTPKYEKYKALKMAYEKMVKTLKYVRPSLEKDTGNSGEIKKCIDALEDIEVKMKTAYTELEEEMSLLHHRGGRSSSDRRIGGKNKELN